MDVIKHLRYGWPLNYTKATLPHSDTKRNHKGATEHMKFIDKWLDEEVSRGRIRGPFPAPPLPNFVVSPLNTVPKPDSEERRVIVDLSWPHGHSVNDGIEVDTYLGKPSKLRYPTVDDICKLIRTLGRGCFIYKRDLKAAYRQFRVDPNDYNLLGYLWNGNFYYDTVLCMGQRTAAIGCQRSTKSVAFIHSSRGSPCVVYIDDFIGVSTPSNAKRDFTSLGELLFELGLEENVPKSCEPATRQTCLGVLYDTEKLTISVTPERLTDTRILLSAWTRKRKANRTELQQLIGKLIFISKCVRSSRVFVNRILRLLRTAISSNSNVTLTSDFKKDIAWWHKFLGMYNGVSIIPDITWSDTNANISTDACLTGRGAVCHRLKQYFHFEFPDFILNQNLDIHHLELLTVLAAVRTWAYAISAERIRIYCDNTASVYGINSGRTQDDFVAGCLRELWLACSLNDIEIRAEHVPGLQNRLPDWLSRWHLNNNVYKNLFLNNISSTYSDIYFDVELLKFSCI